MNARCALGRFVIGGGNRSGRSFAGFQNSMTGGYEIAPDQRTLEGVTSAGMSDKRELTNFLYPLKKRALEIGRQRSAPYRGFGDFDLARNGIL